MVTRMGMVPTLTNCCLFSSGTWNMDFNQWPNRQGGVGNWVLNAPEWVILSSTLVTFCCPCISLDQASQVRGTRAPDLAIFVLLLLCPFVFFVLSYLVRIIILYLYSASILYYWHLPLTGLPYLPEITEISILSSLTAKYLSACFYLPYSDRLSHGSLPSRPLTPLDSPPYYNTYMSLSYDPIRLIFVAVDASPYCAPSGAFCRS